MDRRIDRSGPAVTAVNRRLFLQHALTAACFCAYGACTAPPSNAAMDRRGLEPQGRRRRFTRTTDPGEIPAYAYRTLSVSHFPALQKEYERALSSEQFSRREAFRNDVANLGFALPGDFESARSVVVVAVFAKTMYATFHLNGKAHRIMVPPQYYHDDLNAGSLRTIVEKEIVKEPSRRVVDVSERVPLKLLAARSGLGQYGRNNLIFVDGMGSYNLLYAFLTDQVFQSDSWTDLTILDVCRRCDHCDRICPTDCIPWNSFVIDIDKCLPLYNEHAGTFPSWIPSDMHHALVGCIRCQVRCRVNDWVANVSGDLGEISEQETRAILQGGTDGAQLRTVQEKLRLSSIVSTEEMASVLARNLRALIEA